MTTINIETTSASGANPTATAGPTAVNGSAVTFLRSDGAPAVQLGTSSQKGIVQVDGTSITASAGVISATGTGLGNVSGPGSSTDRSIATWNSTTGITLRDNSLATISSAGNLTANNFSGVSSGTNTGDQSGANPTATGSDVAINGSAVTFLRSDGSPAIQKTSSTLFGLSKVDNSTITASSGVISTPGGANPSATGSNTAVNGTAMTFMRSDGAPAIQLTSSSVFGLCKVDNSTITASGGVISASGGSGAVTLITETVTSGSQGNVTFSSISSSYRDLEIRIRGRSTGAVINDNIKLQFNGDTGSNYHAEIGVASGTGVAGAQNLSTTAITRILDLPGASSTASYSGTGIIIIGDYKGTTFFKSAAGLAGMSFTTGSGLTQAQMGGGIWLSTSAITSIKIFFVSGSWVDNSVVSLYGHT